MPLGDLFQTLPRLPTYLRYRAPQTLVGDGVVGPEARDRRSRLTNTNNQERKAAEYHG